ncbi:hypothetical protein NESM_000502600 [Novymonas esmeraldas]|uniref:Uncharacterized protein n=1 Tax=Novymonas esmeraldas TaxID=1808958 RepID=A0AAW0EST1_9TRYP
MSHSDATADAAAETAPILGECVLTLTHSTTYEPPLYLFPELLPRVPQGTPPLPVWDAVADAVDIGASSWRVADATQLVAAGVAAAAEASGGAPSVPAERKPRSMATLTSMIAENRLAATGLDASALEKDAFSSAAIITHLATLQARMGLSDEEGAAIMSNHFINLLAWQKLRELNGSAGHRGACRGDGRHGASEAASSSSSPSSPPSTLAQPAPVPSRKRWRAAVDGEDCDTWLPSPHPWATEAELARPDEAGRFVAAGEVHAERQVELLCALADLYGRPWRTLASCGQQTDFVVPPGTVNVTSPYADNAKLPGAVLDPSSDLGWVPASSAAPHAAYFGRVCVAHTATFYSVVVSATQSGVAAPPPTRVPLDEPIVYFGRQAGPQPAAAVAAAATTPIAGALAPYTTRPELLSRFHFALVLRPVYEQVADMADNAPSTSEARVSKCEPCDDSGGEGSETASAAHERQTTVVHTKRPHHYTLWLVNYGRHGVRVVGRGWVLGEPRQLHAGDVLLVGNEVQVRVEEHAAAAEARASAESGVIHATASHASSQVKQERIGEE